MRIADYEYRILAHLSYKLDSNARGYIVVRHTLSNTKYIWAEFRLHGNTIDICPANFYFTYLDFLQMTPWSRSVIRAIESAANLAPNSRTVKLIGDTALTTIYDITLLTPLGT